MYVPFTYMELANKWNREDQQAKENAWRDAQEKRAQAEFGWRQAEQDRQEAGRTAVRTGSQEMLDRMNDAGAGALDWQQPLGVRTPDAVASQVQGGYNPAKDSQAADMGEGNAVSAGLQAAPAQIGLQPPSGMWGEQEGLLKSKLKQALATGDGKLYQEAQNDYFNLRKQRTAAEMMDHFSRADENERARLVNSIAGHSGGRVKATQLQDGTYNLSIDGADTRMSWPALQRFLVGRAIGSIDEMRGAMSDDYNRVQDDNKTVLGVARENGTARLHQSQIAMNSAHANYYNRASSAEGKVDHFSEKQFNRVLENPPKTVVGFIDEDGKLASEPGLTDMYINAMSAAQASGMPFPDAQAKVSAQVNGFRNKMNEVIAQAKAGKVYMTPSQAFMVVQRDFQQKAAAANAAQSQPPQAGVQPPSKMSAGQLASQAGGVSVPTSPTQGSVPQVIGGRSPIRTPDRQKEISDLQQRLALKGVDPQVAMQYQLRLNELLDGGRVGTRPMSVPQPR